MLPDIKSTGLVFRRQFAVNGAVLVSRRLLVLIPPPTGCPCWDLEQSR